MSLRYYATRGERRVAKRLIAAALEDGYLVSVDDGEETTVRRSTDRDEILDALATTGIDHVSLYLPDVGHIGTITLIYGNDEDGSELIADWTMPGGGEEINRFMQAHDLAPV